MWEDGIFLGVKGTTGEIIVGDKKGVWRTRTVRRKTVEERWHPKTLELVGGVPWRTDGSEGDGDDLKNEVTIMYRQGCTGRRSAMLRNEGYTVRYRGWMYDQEERQLRQEHSDAYTT